MFEILLCSYFGLGHTSSFEIIHTRIDDRQFVILFLCTITDITRTKILSKFQIISKLPAVRSCAFYQNFLEQNSKAPSYRSMKQLGVPWVKRGEGFCYFDCNIFYFGRIKLSWYSRQAFCSCSVSNGIYGGCFTTKSNSNMKNSMLMLTRSVFEWKISFLIQISLRKSKLFVKAEIWNLD